MEMKKLLITGLLCLLSLAGPSAWAVTVADNECQVDEAALREVIGASVTATMTDQIVFVEDHTLSFWNKGADGVWHMDFSTYCGYGKRGLILGIRKEGSGTTPVGAFELTQAFGIAPDPGAAMPYRQVDDESYWSGEPEDYNQWVQVKRGTRSMPNSEHLISYTVPYQYVMAIGFNMHPVVQGVGSAIFLHCKGEHGWDTAGCVSIEQRRMVQLIRQCRPGTRIIIVPKRGYVSLLGL